MMLPRIASATPQYNRIGNPYDGFQYYSTGIWTVWVEDEGLAIWAEIGTIYVRPGRTF